MMYPKRISVYHRFISLLLFYWKLASPLFTGKHKALHYWISDEPNWFCQKHSPHIMDGCQLITSSSVNMHVLVIKLNISRHCPEAFEWHCGNKDYTLGCGGGYNSFRGGGGGGGGCTTHSGTPVTSGTWQVNAGQKVFNLFSAVKILPLFCFCTSCIPLIMNRIMLWSISLGCLEHWKYENLCQTSSTRTAWTRST